MFNRVINNTTKNSNGVKKVLIPFSITLVGIIVGGVLFFSGIGVNNDSLSVDSVQAGTRKLDLEIQNMFCIGCRSSVVNTLRSISGVIQADADPNTNSGWVIYDSNKVSKDQILASTIFLAYPATFIDDQPYGGVPDQQEVKEIPAEIQLKLNELAQRLLNRGIELESFFQEELDDAINRGYWDKANNLLDNYLQSIY